MSKWTLLGGRPAVFREMPPQKHLAALRALSQIHRHQQKKEAE